MSPVVVVCWVVGGVIAVLVALVVLIIVKRPREYVGDGKFE